MGQEVKPDAIPTKLILRSFFYSYIKDNAKNPKKKLLNTSERNIASHLQSSLDVVKNFHLSLLKHQVDMEQKRAAVCGTFRVFPDIILHKRGIKAEETRGANYMCIEIKKIEHFNGDVQAITTKKKKRQLEKDLEKLRCFRRDKNHRFTLGMSVVISDPHTIFFNINDSEYMKCSIREVPLKKQKRFVEIMDRVIFITKDRDFTDKSSYHAKVKEYEKEIDQIITSCLI